jgi:hypothetical protein
VERASDVGICSATRHVHTHFQRAFDVVALRWGPIPLKTWPHGPACSIMPMHSSSIYATYATSSLSFSGPLPVSGVSIDGTCLPLPTNFDNQYTSRSHITHGYQAHCSMHPPTLFGHFCIDPRLPFWGRSPGAQKGNALLTYKLCGRNLCTGTFALIPGVRSGAERRGLKGQCPTDIRTLWIACRRVAT